MCITCGKTVPRTSKFCGYDGTDSTLALSAGNVCKICTLCGRFFPGYANFCAFDSSSLEVLKGQGSTGPQVATPQQLILI